MKRILLTISALLVAGAALSAFYVYELKRLRPASETVYRAGQIDEADLREAVVDFGLKTVINLRGDNPKSEWYQEEVQACRDLGLEYREYRFESFEHPPQHETRLLVRDLLDQPRPVLVHCRSGHDRSGWAAAVARVLDGDPVDQAVEEELAVLEGHYCDRETCSLHGFFRSYETWLERNGLNHSPEQFADWVLEHYAPGWYDAEISILDRPDGSVPPGEAARYRVRVSNASPDDWPAGPDRSTGVRLGVRRIGPWTERPENELRMFRRFRSPAIDIHRSSHGPVASGESIEVGVELRAPDQPGRYTLQFDMVEEGTAWFSEHGAPGALDVLLVE